MRRFLTATAAMGLVFSMAAPLALAQPAPPGPGQHENNKVVHPNNSNNNNANHAQNGNHDTVVQHQTTIVQNGHLNTPGPAYHQPVYGAPRPPVGHEPVVVGHQWHRGDRYTGSREVVTDWSRYHVQRPPSGYEYVRDGNQLVLIAVASGVIASVLANALYQ